jgi:FkbM family methyltransferase
MKSVSLIIICLLSFHYFDLHFSNERNNNLKKDTKNQQRLDLNNNVPLPFNCSTSQRDAQRGRISFEESCCPSSSFLNLLYETAFRCSDVLILNVGANKGYVLAELLFIFAPRAKIGPIQLGHLIENYGVSLEDFSGCGVCNDCKHNPSSSSAAACSIHPRIILHAFEPLPANVHLLKMTIEPLINSVENLSLTVHSKAIIGDANIKTVPFENCGIGIEWCSIKSAGGGNTINVEAASLDSWAAANLASDDVIDLLFVDAEGYDPDVLRGAHSLFSSGRVRVFQFEYHGINVWTTTTLESVISFLSELGYSCFLVGRAFNSVLLTGCFDPTSMEKKQWSNVLCVRRNEYSALATLYAMSGL